MMQREMIIQKLKESGCRITKQRLMLLDIILEEDCSCCKEIYFKASKVDPKIGVATVYRMVTQWRISEPLSVCADFNWRVLNS